MCKIIYRTAPITSFHAEPSDESAVSDMYGGW